MSVSAEAPSTAASAHSALTLIPARCCICDHEDADPIGVGEDFEYRTSADSFLAVRCRGCGLVYLNPRPSQEDLGTIYPPTYHAFEFSEERFGLVYQVRRRLEARRLLSWCKGLPEDARILDVGCGDGFHLSLLRDFGGKGWQLEGVDPSEHAAATAARTGLTVHQGTVQDLNLPAEGYDFAFMIQTIEHLDDPAAVLRSVRRLLKPGAMLGIVTDNTGSLDFRLFRGRHWGGYHFPRHFYLFDRASLRALASKVSLDVAALTTMVSPVNWVYSVRNSLVDYGAPSFLVERFSLRAPAGLAVFTLFDNLHQLAGRGALLRALLRRPL
jgi:SAM-dependent methyltransferase